jgi:hypothetical protein
MGGKGVPAVRVTRDQVPNPGVSVDVRDMANKQNGGVAERPSRKATLRRKGHLGRSDPATRGQPTPEHLAIYADYISGKSLDFVAAKYGCHKSWVSAITRKVDRWLVPQFMGDIREIKCQHTERLLHIVCEAMGAWERSKQPKVRISHKRGEDGKLTVDGITREPQAGNPTFLATAMKALEDIRKVWGADAPVRVEVDGEIRVAGRSLEEARAELAQQMAEARERLISSSRN